MPPPPRSWLERILRGDTGYAPDTVFTLCEADPTSRAPGSWEKPGTALLLWVRPPRPRRENREDGCPRPECHYCFPKSVPGTDTTLVASLVSAHAHANPSSCRVGRPLSPSFPSARAACLVPACSPYLCCACLQVSLLSNPEIIPTSPSFRSLPSPPPKTPSLIPTPTVGLLQPWCLPHPHAPRVSSLRTRSRQAHDASQRTHAAQGTHVSECQVHGRQGAGKGQKAL